MTGMTANLLLLLSKPSLSSSYASARVYVARSGIGFTPRCVCLQCWKDQALCLYKQPSVRG